MNALFKELKLEMREDDGAEKRARRSRAERRIEDNWQKKVNYYSLFNENILKSLIY